MAETTVKEFAQTVGIPVERLQAQLEAAGLGRRDDGAALSAEDKATLLAHLRQGSPEQEEEGGGSDGSPKKITLKRRSHSQLKMPAGRDAGSRGPRQTRTVNVEVRKRRTYVKRSDIEAEEKRKQEEAEEAAAQLERALEQEEAKREEDAAEAQRAGDTAVTGGDEAEQAPSEEAAPAEEAEPSAADAEAVEESGVEVQAAEPEETAADETARAQAEALKEKPKSQQDEAKKREEERERKRAELEAKREREAEERAQRKQEAKPKKKKAEQPAGGRGAGARRGGKKRGGGTAAKQLQQEFERPTAPVVREVEIPETITVAELADRMSVKAAALIKEMMKQGVMATINQAIDQETAAILVEEMGHKPKLQRDDDVEEELLRQGEQPEGEQIGRAPVVTVMGHVDHGKTSLLDYIRRAKVASGEAGGITQHIGAYRVEGENGSATFLDTPGHQAFTAMRARGAQMTDIVVLVVAADDGVMPQTKEAVEHARAAEVPIVVAVNKMDKEDADPNRVKQELSQMEVIPEEWGGDVQFVHVSAMTGEGMDELIEAIVLQAELQELKAVKDCPARGVVLESSLDKGRGPVATVLVQNGYLHRGDTVISGTEFGRVRALVDEHGKRVNEAGPSTPVEVLGLSGLPDAGDDIMVVEDERKAREVAESRSERQREKRLAQQQAARMENLFSQMKEDEVSTINLLVKADVHGSAEALRQSLEDLSHEEVRVRVVSSGVGAITESDVNLALASEAIMIGFNVRADAAAKRMVQEHGVDLHYYSVIYDAIEQVKNAISGMLEPTLEEHILGTAEVREVFRSSKLGQVAGCLVVDGVVRRRNPIRVLRDSVVIYEGELESLRRFKDDVNEVRAGTECGIGVKNYNDVRAGDQIECYERVEVQRSL
ncbi:translation initiation factor IF-2 [Halorhodospira halophila]|uniref:Translation initiation factor IF-2 n=1 Tax=Halorhodospira halophila (strain DSM 244 / SL1) TaxID=349124 RepID=IF2_HALHL|nr:translation initiation factor IF-2 [Halorhodospira halophila]A1WXV1.1 RecName: Full=Translation initiation factor IF-2 [Halorhodospira halophila SL1]ABM62513.1 bacterial translation initiation factor 2 (bIF-2) [Halorhodospira halophila SL1]MBK1728190.1 translation initiation factor IF-2 [Halorhodospira halophila]